MVKILLLQLLTLSSLNTINAVTPTIKRFASKETATQTQALETIVVTMPLEKGQALYKDTLSFTTNNPQNTISAWTSEQTPAPFFDQKTKETRPAYQGTVTFKLNLTGTDKTTPTDLFMHYMTNSDKAPQEHRFTLNGNNAGATENNHALQQTQQDSTTTTSSELPAVTTQRSFGHLVTDFFHRMLNKINHSVASLKNFASNLFTSTESRGIQFLLAFILGVLMSLTPCIYPMIPITVGLLGTGTHNTFARNFSLAFSYTVGLASTFAIIGLLAALFGTQSGQILSNPWFVIALVAILAYLGCSMLGWYEMRIPKFLQPKTQTVQKGSYLSAFLFGMGSGTIASPCMSPGLALVLSAVNSIASTAGAGIASSLLGFALLFVFGLGSSLPLLIIGTFSASLHVLPRAGMWMVEIKKVFGFMLLGMCFYYLKNILPATMCLSMTSLFFIIVGGYYLNQVLKARTFVGRFVTFVLSFILITTGIYTFYTAYTSYNPVCAASTADHAWRTDYAQAREEAIAKNQKLLLDFGASWCSLCGVLEKDILNSPEVTALFDKVIAVKIDGSKSGDEPYTSLVKEFKIFGLPTILLIDPTTNTVIKQWGSELISKPKDTLTTEVLAALA